WGEASFEAGLDWKYRLVEDGEWNVMEMGGWGDGEMRGWGERFTSCLLPPSSSCCKEVLRNSY
ncbi:hypothetical protein A0J48_025860, partial [Sphaerospermopsis aphanizomenoides BCCUSP55]|uniref:hypothetical protein n=1 Tax=Sphaerospermopsis aphanizomenoides TaxID=459663 RepID=UPI0019038972